ncbi:oligosaccharide flippase family protein [Methanoculleus receptaculi]|uniref:Oligosaccharide flippase family protein n=1 Tax=Methanoculleus receptaculi TaxID=394967 RepID=A0AAX4FS43_9EURY|nr:oligosaccharide flippase family protein [Methanoculleus receptaculi]WOX56756.1 oligosaccharide flippase family protein [Methanoculleus receptaculi]
MQEYHQFARRIGLIGATNLLISLSGLILLPILTKTLPIEEYGTYVQVTVTIGLVPAVVMLGLPYTMVRFLAGARSREEIQEGYYSIVGITVVTAGLASLALFILAEPIAAALFDNRVAIIQVLAAIVFLECMNEIQYNYFRTFQQIKRYSSLTFFKTCLQLTLVCTLVLAGYGILGATIGLLVTDVVLLIIMSILIVSEIGVAVPKFRHLREYLSFGLPTVPGNLSSWVVNSSDRYVIALFLGTAYVGYYSPGYTLGNIVNMFIAPLSFMLPAVLSKHYDDGNLNDVKTILSYSMKYFLALAIPSVVGLSLLSRPLLTILSTPEIAEQGYLITPFTALSGLLFGSYAVIMQILVLEKKTGISGTIWIVAAILNLGLNIIFVPIFGIIGAAVTTLLAYSLAFLLSTYYSFKYLVFDLNAAFILKCIIAAAIMGGVVVIGGSRISGGLVSILLLVIISALVYTAGLFILRGFKKEEILFFKGLLRI